MAVPYTFGTATASIPLSQLDSNFATVITLGNTAIQLGNTVTTLNNMTLANVTISSGNITLTNVSATTANVTTANVVTMIITGNETVQGNTTVTGTITGAKLIPTGSSVTGNGMYLPATNSVGISTNGTNAVYIDASQNVGIGTTLPSTKLQVFASSVPEIRIQSGSFQPALSFYTDNTTTPARNWAIIADNVAYGDLTFQQSNALGGNPITAGTTRMIIDSSGNVGIGTSSPGAKLDVAGGNIQVRASYKVITDKVENYGSALTLNAAGSLPIYFALNGTTAMTLDTSGNLGIGTSSPNQKLDVAGSMNLSASGVIGWGGSQNYFIQSDNANWLRFGTAGSERARIDSSGNLLVGATSASPTAGAGTKTITGTSAQQYIVGAATTNATDAFSVYSTGAGAYRCEITYAGQIFATVTTISSISDIRYKENIRDLNVGLDKIMALKPRLYDWKEGKGADIKNARGFIAQEFEQVFPDLIDEWKDPAPEGEEPYKSVRQDLIPVLVKAIQEQQALITSLTARIEALEAK